MDKKQPSTIGTLIHGIAASEHIDSSGERLSIRGLDISSLEVDGMLNYEHKSDTPAQLVGKILKAKKIFDEKDCASEGELYFWNKSQAPFVYIIGELFDKVGHAGAKEVAAILEYDAQAKKAGRQGKNVINFSIEGSKIKKVGNEIVRSLARKTTITALPCNKVAVAEKLEIPQASKEDSLLSMFKSEELVSLEKNAKVLQMPNMPKEKPNFGPKIGSTKSGKDIFHSAKPVDYSGFSADDHHDAMNIHMNAAAGKDFKTANQHRLMARFHAGARDRLQARSASVPKSTAVAPKSATPKTSFDPSLSGKVDYFKKSITAGSGMGAPSTKVQGDALAKEDLSSSIEKFDNYSKLLKFVKDKYPEMAKDEAEALAKYMAAREIIKAEEVLEKMYDMDKSKNVREQKRKIFGTDPNAPRLSEKRRKMMNVIRDYAGKKYNMDLVTAQGKRDKSGKLREEADLAHEPFDVFTERGAKQEARRLARLKEMGVKRTDPKPHWHGSTLETQPSPDAAVHELAHLDLAPEGRTAQDFQLDMDAAYARHGKEYGHAQGKRTAWEVQPMSIENPIRREMGLPANRTSKAPMSPEQVEKLNQQRAKRKLPPLEIDPETGSELTFDDKRPRFNVGTDGKFYDRQSRLQSPETRERVQDIREGTLKFHPSTGWYKETSPDALINLRGRGKTDEAKARAQQRYMPVSPKKMAASEMEKAQKGVHETRPEYKNPGRSEAGANASIARRAKQYKVRPHDEFFTEKARNIHSEKLKELKSMPKPNLPKSEMAKKDKIGKYGLSTNQSRTIRYSNEKGVNKPFAMGTGEVGISSQGYTVRGGARTISSEGNRGQEFRQPQGGSQYDRNMARKKAKETLSDLKLMPKPSLPKSEAMASYLTKRCWEGYKPVPGKKPYSKGSCEKK